MSLVADGRRTVLQISVFVLLLIADVTGNLSVKSEIWLNPVQQICNDAGTFDECRAAHEANGDELLRELAGRNEVWRSVWSTLYNVVSFGHVAALALFCWPKLELSINSCGNILDTSLIAQTVATWGIELPYLYALSYGLVLGLPRLLSRVRGYCWTQ